MTIKNSPSKDLREMGANLLADLAEDTIKRLTRIE